MEPLSQIDHSASEYIIKELQLRTRSSVLGQISLLGVFCALLVYEEKFSALLGSVILAIVISNVFRMWRASSKKVDKQVSAQISVGIALSAIGWGLLLMATLYHNKEDTFVYVVDSFIVAGLTSGSLFSLGLSRRDFTIFILSILVLFNWGMISFADSKVSLSLFIMSVLFIPFLLRQRSIYFKEFMILLKAKQTLEDQQVQLVSSAKMAALGEMSGGIAHEINNPLAIIAGKAQLLKKALLKFEDNESTQKMIGYSNDIHKTANRIAVIVKGLRSFARDAGQDPFVLTPITQVIDETFSFCEARFASHDIEVRKINTTSTVAIECRSAQISQVLLNTLSNAFDAIDKHENKWIELEVIDLDSTVKIIITDSGPGIPVELQDKLMNPFFTTKEVGKGTGLGLSLSRGIIDSHKGKFDFDFDHKNTRIIIELPKKHSI